MNKKPVIVIMTSKDEYHGLSQKIADAIRKIGMHNTVVMSDDKYGSASRLSALDRLMDRSGEYQYLLERKDKGVIKDNLKPRKFSKRVNRIRNMLKRFHPEYILCLTPYAHHCAVEAKRKLKFQTNIIYMLPNFTAPKRKPDELTNVFIVENADMKVELVRMGIRSKDIMVMGFAYDIEPKTPDEVAEGKNDLGLLRNKTVFVNFQNRQQLINVFNLLIDQGDFANIVVYAEDPKLIRYMNEISVRVPEAIVVYVQSRDRMDDYLSISDVAVTDYNAAVLYKCFKLGIPPIVLTEDEHAMQDINYLSSRGLCLKAKEDIDVIAYVYKLFQTSLARKIGEAGREWTKLCSLDNIAAFLASYIGIE